MIIVKIQGGLGNQMFQYAYGYALAKRYGVNMVLDIHNFNKDELRDFKLQNFNITYRDVYEFKKLPFLIKLFENKYVNKLLRLAKISKIHLPNYIYYLQVHFDYISNNDTFKKDKNVYVSGYWQNPKFFETYEKELMKEFTPNYIYNKSLTNIINSIENNNSVSIHVRRSDYLLNKNKRFQIKDKYYSEALKTIFNNVNQPKFYVFSDDIEWCKSFFEGVIKAEYVSVEGEHADISEMMCISKCKNNINANSSFSWWASWLNNNNEKIVVNPDRYWNRGMIPKKWIVIKNVGIDA